MKKRIPVLLLLTILSVICGYLFHKISWIGRLGINIAYDEYTIFKSWWKSSLLVFGIYMALYLIHYLACKNKPLRSVIIINTVSILLAIGGLYYTYHDFRTDFSHRIAGERFHLGFYLFWVGWIVINLHFIIRKQPNSANKQL